MFCAKCCYISGNVSKKETLFVALNSELSLSHSKATEVSVKERVNVVRDWEIVHYTFIFGE